MEEANLAQEKKLMGQSEASWQKDKVLTAL